MLTCANAQNTVLKYVHVSKGGDGYYENDRIFMQIEYIVASTTNYNIVNLQENAPVIFKVTVPQQPMLTCSYLSTVFCPK